MPMTPVAELPLTVWTDFVRLFLGKFLGSGVSREVYELAINRELVVKIERARGFQNVLEWRTWNDLKHTDYAQYLAPCEAISPCGTVLLMRRARPLPPEKENTPLPSFLSDFKHRNYGMLEGRVVCVDYGDTKAISMGAEGSVLESPEWWKTEWWHEDGSE